MLHASYMEVDRIKSNYVIYSAVVHMCTQIENTILQH